MLDHLNMDYLWDSGAGVVGDPDRCIEISRSETRRWDATC
jgi:hypothetical protein